MFEELNLNFSQNEILKCIKQLKTNKSGGPDMLINEFCYTWQTSLSPNFM